MEKKQIEVLGNGNVRVTIPLIFKIAGGRTRIFTPDSEHVAAGMLNRRQVRRNACTSSRKFCLSKSTARKKQVSSSSIG